MSIVNLLSCVIDKKKFESINDYIAFCSEFLKFSETGFQKKIISKNESHYQFFQYKKDGNFNITRPINSELMLGFDCFDDASTLFLDTIARLRKGQVLLNKEDCRNNICSVLYTVQQSIGCVLDALPAGKSNQARKINGDLFERLIRLTIKEIGTQCVSGTMLIPVFDDNGNELFRASYQHDLLISKGDELKIIGSVKTSSKDRIDKVFMDKFLYNKLTNTDLPHIAIFLNDVQRKNTRMKDEYGINATFLPGHFKAYTIKLNHLDGVYYCDLRPNMVTDELLSNQIKTIDHLFIDDLQILLNRKGKSLQDIKISNN
jgi:hypothetical protein